MFYKIKITSTGIAGWTERFNWNKSANRTPTEKRRMRPMNAPRSEKRFASAGRGRKAGRLRNFERRTQDPKGTRRNILEIATDEFADKGFSGARVDHIAARTDTSKRMIYYYFG